MLGSKRVPAPATLVHKYPELRKFADPVDELDRGEPTLQFG